MTVIQPHNVFINMTVLDNTRMVDNILGIIVDKQLGYIYSAIK